MLGVLASDPFALPCFKVVKFWTTHAFALEQLVHFWASNSDTFSISELIILSTLVSHTFIFGAAELKVFRAFHLGTLILVNSEAFRAVCPNTFAFFHDKIGVARFFDAFSLIPLPAF